MASPARVYTLALDGDASSEVLRALIMGDRNSFDSLAEPFDPQSESSLRITRRIDNVDYLVELRDLAMGLSDVQASNAIAEADGVILAYLVSSQTGFDRCSRLRQRCGTIKQKPLAAVPMILVGFVDVDSERIVSASSGSKQAEAWNVPFFEVSGTNAEPALANILSRVRDTVPPSPRRSFVDMSSSSSSLASPSLPAPIVTAMPAPPASANAAAAAAAAVNGVNYNNTSNASNTNLGGKSNFKSVSKAFKKFAGRGGDGGSQEALKRPPLPDAMRATATSDSVSSDGESPGSSATREISVILQPQPQQNPALFQYCGAVQLSSHAKFEDARLQIARDAVMQSVLRSAAQAANRGSDVRFAIYLMRTPNFVQVPIESLRIESRDLDLYLRLV